MSESERREENIFILLVFTSVTSVDDELGGLKCPGLAQALATHTHAAGISNFRLADHNSDGTTGNMATVLLDVHQVLSDLLGNK